MAILALLLTGCQSVELYSDLSEREANDMLAVLLNHDIAATRQRKKEWVTLSVPRADTARAIEILRLRGYPRERFTDLGQIFQKQGLISSPMEERVRYTFGLSQMLSEALTQIDGVLAARVLIVLPQDPPFGQAATPSSASIFIRYRSGWELQDLVPSIKTFVQNSVNGLSYERISVALFPQQEFTAPEWLAQPVPSRTDPNPLWVVVLLGALAALTSGLSLYLWWRQRRLSTAMGSRRDA